MAEDGKTTGPPTTTEVEMELISRGYVKHGEPPPPIDGEEEPDLIVHHEPLPIIHIQPEPDLIIHHEPPIIIHEEPPIIIHEEPHIEPYPDIGQEEGNARYYLAGLYAALSFLAKERDLVIPY